ncbi:MAG: hypothetical protein U9Q62_10750 [Campylobacterota bacterium]|nr:hypothetical protein [Campylobacterota bacterium]
MKPVLLFNTRAAFILLLLGNTAFALQTRPLLTSHTDINYKSADTVHKHIAESLEAKGLDRSTAWERTDKLFTAETINIDLKLHHLANHPTLSLSGEAVNQGLAKRALFEKPLNLDAYDSLVGFVQEIKGHSLDEHTLEAVGQISTLNRSFSS